jgi:phosphoglycerate dehydrogenase-like enzyme
MTVARARIAVLDDWQKVARRVADWSALERRADVRYFEQPIGSEDETAAALEDFDIVIAMRERTPFPASLIDRLPALRMIALTGTFSGTLDLDACTRRGIVVCNTGGTRSDATTAEITLALLMAAARHLPAADRNVRAGRFQEGVAPGLLLEGRTLGVVGLGRIGSRVARLGAALGMQVLGWSQNLTDEAARAAGARRVDKATLFAQSDVVSLHLKLSARTRHVVGSAELAAMKPGAILVNSSRGGLVDEAALLDRLRAGTLTAALDVYWSEPLPPDHPLLGLPNVVLSPHLGYCTEEVYTQFYRESIENVLAFLDGRPIRMMNSEALPSAR